MAAVIPSSTAKAAADSNILAAKVSPTTWPIRVGSFRALTISFVEESKKPKSTVSCIYVIQLLT